MMEKLAKWYVYQLIDPTTMATFYIGKGTGNRINDHEIESARGVCSKKCNKIRALKDAGFEINKQKIAFFWDEQAAYDFETDCIEETGLKNLTNILPGGQKAFERRAEERKARKVINKKQEWNAKKAFEFLKNAINNKTMFAVYFKEWLKNSDFGRLKAKVETKESCGEFTKVQGHIIEKLFNEKFAEIFNLSLSDKQQHSNVVVMCKSLGIDLKINYGC
jgi:hypothetical protein